MLTSGIASWHIWLGLGQMPDDAESELATVRTKMQAHRRELRGIKTNNLQQRSFRLFINATYAYYQRI
ncbi:hypothetical protein BH11VER1_BH11VER1_20430 [soil metagenome]